MKEEAMGISTEGTLDTINHDAQEIQKSADSLVIERDEQYSAAGEFLKTIKGLMAKINKTMTPVIEAAHAAHREALAAKKGHYKPLEDAEKVIKSKMGAYHQIQEEKRRIEERRLQAEAQARARKEAEEAQEKARKEAEEERIRQAVELEEKGKEEEAEQLLEEPIEVPTVEVPVVQAPIAPPATPKVEGISTRKVWKWKVTDSTKIPRHFMVMDEKAINAHVRVYKESTAIEGIEVYEDNVISARG